MRAPGDLILWFAHKLWESKTWNIFRESETNYDSVSNHFPLSHSVNGTFDWCEEIYKLIELDGRSGEASHVKTKKKQKNNIPLKVE